MAFRHLPAVGSQARLIVLHERAMSTLHRPTPSSPAAPVRSSGSAYAGPLRAVIFDWAGTAVDFGSRAPVMALTALFAGRGIALSEDQARSAMGI